MTTDSQSPESWWDIAKGLMSQGIIPYVLLCVFSLSITVPLLLNPSSSLSTDILFIFFLGTVLVTYRARVVLPFKLGLLVILLGGILPYFGSLNPFYMDLATQVGIFVVLALGLNVVVGFAGLLDLGYVAFYAVGAYLWAIFSTGQANNFIPGELFPLSGWWFFAFLIIAIGVGALTGVLLGLPVLRLRGDYLAIVTLGFGEVIRVLALNLDTPVNITNGAQGIRAIGRPPLFFEPWLRSLGVELSTTQLYQLFFYFMVLMVVGITVLVVLRLNNSRIGRAWTAIREDETAAIAMGIPLVRMKLMAFAVGASFAAVMGVIFASKQLFINPPTFDLIRSISILSMVILGGMGSIPGVILGATLVTLLNLQMLPRIATELRGLQQAGVPIPAQFDPTQYQRMIFGLMLILMTIFRPEGILPEDRRRQELHGDEEEIVVEPEDDTQDESDDSPTTTKT
ncbi:MAG: branched-chain amino acid ABC transporter permease [Chloroflexi bacterium AL-W]|nr:branched-chain amino acid ABC transporter permease [Chloroflexi bacterium AL-N1]NOK66880.1 branched-chain amino acid ABC transporter permease [Chloroflexi bacterium AL-N10]NOK74828.1 branched-chain amino acid ABC transporter permease [Chloroflexi bacterium AL-N5]NOK81482.1 branched-chain amino acid ABC transporter permease [Chloroflexi bacterium AL-W]NOK88952.1 branched-chain amino acid ABC transporter permease [Chloroflexi bacterium AL-N15]